MKYFFRHTTRIPVLLIGFSVMIPALVWLWGWNYVYVRTTGQELL